MKNPYAEWFEQLRAEYGVQLDAMPLPDGLPAHLHDLVKRGDEEGLIFMIKLAWQFGAQVGYAAGAGQEDSSPAAPRITNLQA